MVAMKKIELEDNSPMPYGKHKGTPMIDLSASYLLSLWDFQLKDQTNLTDSQKQVKDYVEDNLLALMDETNK